MFTCYSCKYYWKGICCNGNSEYFEELVVLGCDKWDSEEISMIDQLEVEGWID